MNPKRLIHEANFQYFAALPGSCVVAPPSAWGETDPLLRRHIPLPIEKIAESVRRMSVEILK